MKVVDRKTGLVIGRVVTENMKRTALEAISKYYAEKGFQDAKTEVDEKKDNSLQNSLQINFIVDKGQKTRINNINFAGNTIDQYKLKSRLKDTKEQTRLTLYPPDNKGGFITPKPYTFQEYLIEKGFLTFTLTKKVLDPYIRLKFFTSAKFNEKKYTDDKEKLIDYYNSLGYKRRT